MCGRKGGTEEVVVGRFVLGFRLWVIVCVNLEMKLFLERVCLADIYIPKATRNTK